MLNIWEEEEKERKKKERNKSRSPIKRGKWKEDFNRFVQSTIGTIICVCSKEKKKKKKKQKKKNSIFFPTRSTHFALLSLVRIERL